MFRGIVVVSCCGARESSIGLCKHGSRTKGVLKRMVRALEVFTRKTERVLGALEQRRDVHQMENRAHLEHVVRRQVAPVGVPRVGRDAPPPASGPVAEVDGLRVGLGRQAVDADNPRATDLAAATAAVAVAMQRVSSRRAHFKEKGQRTARGSS